MLRWWGAYTPGTGACTKPPQFRIRFWERANPADPNSVPRGFDQTPKDPDQTVMDITATAVVTNTGVMFNDGRHLDMFEVQLASALVMTNGWFSVQGLGGANCYFMWQGSASGQGDGLVYEYFESAPTETARFTTGVDATCTSLAYCFAPGRYGACCFDLTGQCLLNYAEQLCLENGGYFLLNMPCWEPCGVGPVGACCRCDGACTITREAQCQNPEGCRGDANCDGQKDFGDINAFVSGLSNLAGWQAAHPDCPPWNLDASGDGFVDFRDINGFVHILSTAPGPCETSDCNVWLGPGSECAQCHAVACPPGSLVEDEPQCNPNYVDVTNGGCTDPNTTDPALQPDRLWTNDLCHLRHIRDRRRPDAGYGLVRAGAASRLAVVHP